MQKNKEKSFSKLSPHLVIQDENNRKRNQELINLIKEIEKDHNVPGFILDEGDINCSYFKENFSEEKLEIKEFKNKEDKLLKKNFDFGWFVSKLKENKIVILKNNNLSKKEKLKLQNKIEELYDYLKKERYNWSSKRYKGMFLVFSGSTLMFDNDFNKFLNKMVRESISGGIKNIFVISETEKMSKTIKANTGKYIEGDIIYNKIFNNENE